MNAILALKVMHEFKAAQSGVPNSEDDKTIRNQMLQRLHHVNFSPHELAVRWVTVYIRAWLGYFVLRLKKVKEARDEAEKKKRKDLEDAMEMKEKAKF